MEDRASTVLKNYSDYSEEGSRFPENGDCPVRTNSNKTVAISQNATSFHPLMNSPMSPDFPDLIPEKAKGKIFKPQAHSSHLELELNTAESQDSLEVKLNRALSTCDYSEKLPGTSVNHGDSVRIHTVTAKISDFPESPSGLKQSFMFDLPLEVGHNDLSDTENDKSVYEAHLNSNLQNVSLTLNQKEGTY